MLGNAFEFCDDAWTPTLVSPPQKVPPESHESRVIRGGSWSDPILYARSDSWGSALPYQSDGRTGLRVAFSLPH